VVTVIQLELPDLKDHQDQPVQTAVMALKDHPDLKDHREFRE
jgi:hypothetical protein